MFRFSKSLLWVKRLRTLGLFLITVFIICSSPKEASADPDTLWTRRFGGGPGYDVHQTPEGGFAFVHYLDGLTHLIKTDANGDTVWTRRYIEGLPPLVPQGMALTNDHGFIIAAGSDSVAPTVLIRADSLGDTIWTRQYGFAMIDAVMHVEQSSDGGFVLCGIRVLGFLSYHLFWMKVDSNGDSLWCHRLEGEPWTYAGSIKQTSDGGYIIAGSVDGNGCLIKTDEEGEIVWQKFVGGDFEYGEQTDDGGYIAVGDSWIEWLSTEMIYIVKTNSLGVPEWARTLGESGEWKANWGYEAHQTSDGGYVVVGQIGTWEQRNIYIVKMNYSGGVEWSREYGGGGAQVAYSVEETKTDGAPDGGFIVTGASAGSVLLRLGENSAVNEEAPDLPTIFANIRAYPNPFNSECKIIFGGEKSAAPSLLIYNLLGEKIYAVPMVAEKYGEYSITWDAHNYPSGIYFVRIISGGEIYSRKIVLLK